MASLVARMELDRSPDVLEFFGEHVAHAMRDLKVETSAQTQGYLVDLLSGYTVSHRIHSLAVPLAALLKRATEAAGAQQLALLRELGDAALFLCGFFPDSFDRRGVDRTYVVTMGDARTCSWAATTATKHGLPSLPSCPAASESSPVCWTRSANARRCAPKAPSSACTNAGSKADPPRWRAACGATDCTQYACAGGSFTDERDALADAPPAPSAPGALSCRRQGRLLRSTRSIALLVTFAARHGVSENHLAGSSGTLRRA